MSTLQLFIDFIALVAVLCWIENFVTGYRRFRRMVPRKHTVKL